jgi:TatD DNase family protein
MKYIDIHSHLNFDIFKNDLDKVVARMKEQDLFCINIGTKFTTSKKAVDLALEHENMYAIVGLHPIHVNPSFHDTDEIGTETKPFKSVGEDFNEDDYADLIKNKKVLGVGECGLDYYHTEGSDTVAITKNITRQKENFEKQIEFAIKHDLPIMIHCRDAYDDVLEILKKFKKTAGSKLRGNVHFYAGTIEQADQFLNLDFDISFTGVITFAKQYKELVRFVPLNRIHAETDCPYVAPVPFRGQRNEPVYTIEVIKKFAEIKNENFEEVAKQLILNFKRLFNKADL